jgi:hypothetical protein
MASPWLFGHITNYRTGEIPVNGGKRARPWWSGQSQVLGRSHDKARLNWDKQDRHDEEEFFQASILYILSIPVHSVRHMR